MKDAVLFVSSFIGGLFLGYLISILAFFVWNLIKEGLAEPGRIAIPAIVLLAIFGIALFYSFGIALGNLPLFIGAAITFSYCARPLFRPEEKAENENTKP